MTDILPYVIFVVGMLILSQLFPHHAGMRRKRLSSRNVLAETMNDFALSEFAVSHADLTDFLEERE